MHTQRFYNERDLRDRLAKDFGKFPKVVAHAFNEEGPDGVENELVLFYLDNSAHIATWVPGKGEGWIFSSAYQEAV